VCGGTAHNFLIGGKGRFLKEKFLSERTPDDGTKPAMKKERRQKARSSQGGKEEGP